MTKKAPAKSARPRAEEIAAPRVPDRRALDIRQAIYPAECWHLCRIETLREIGRELDKLLASKTGDDVRGGAEELRRKIDVTQEKAVGAYLKCADETAFVGGQLQGLGAPDFIELDDDEKGGEIKAMWKARRNGKNPWETCEVFIAGEAHEAPLLFNPPFRKVYLDELPDNCIRINLTDKQISAAFMVLEFLQTILQDMTKSAQGATVSQAWQRFVKQIRFYRNGVKQSLAACPKDLFTRWRADAPQDIGSGIGIREAPEVIAEVAAVGFTQRIATADVVSRVFDTLIDHCENKLAAKGESVWIDIVLEELNDQIQHYIKVCDGYEKVMLAWKGLKKEAGMTIMRISQPAPEGVPLLAVIMESKQSAPVPLRSK
ncbi:MAG: hypothetical protein ACYC9P_06765 [Rudaea sp.]